jgi:ABC-type multidrug transport system fused ATPase/permease subunit
MRNSFNKIYQILEAKEKRSLVYISLLLLIGMFLEIFGLGIVFPFILSILNPEKITDFYFINEVLLFFQISEKTTFTQILLAFLIIVYLVKTIFMIYLAYKQNKFISKLNINLSNRLYKTYLSQPLEFHVKNNSSGLIKNIQIEVSYFKSFCMSFITIAIELSLAIAIFLTLIFVETLGAFFVGIYFIFLSIIYYQTVKPVLLRWGKTRETVVKKVSKTLVEGLGAIRELILFGALQTYVSSFEQNNEKLMQINTKNGTFQQLPRLFLEFFAIIGIVIFIFFLLLKGENNDYIISTIGVFVAATFRLIPSVNRILNAFQNIKFYTPSIDLIYNEIFLLTKSTIAIISDEKFDFKSKIEIKNIFFKYLKNQPDWNLEKINLTIKKGEFIGIQGISGSGKSTLIDLLVGLNKPDKGQFLIDGKSRLLSNSNWRKQIGYVSQNIILVDDAILQNIALGENISEIDLDRINLAIEKSGLRSFITSLKDGLDTVVGERGVQLSGGQRQRIGIARALYQNPKILLLDEATSALDEKTEIKIMSSIEKLKEDITIIIVAHRLSTLKQCDSIYEINNQKLKKVG